MYMHPQPHFRMAASSLRPLLLVVLGGLLACACNKKTAADDAPLVLPAASAVTVLTAEPPPVVSAPPPEVPVPAPVGTHAAAHTAPAAGADAGVVKPKVSDSLAACCAGLREEGEKGEPANRSNYRSAGSICDNIAKLVAAGTTKKSDAMASIHAATRGAKLPTACK